MQTMRRAAVSVDNIRWPHMYVVVKQVYQCDLKERTIRHVNKNQTSSDLFFN